jgi:hypothetical protein
MSINRDEFTSSSNLFAARLDVATEEITTFLEGEAVGLVKEVFGYFTDIENNGPERTRKNLKGLVDAYPGGAMGLAAAGLTVIKALAAKKRAANRAERRAEAVSIRLVQDEVTEASTTEAVDEAKRRHPSAAFDPRPYIKPERLDGSHPCTKEGCTNTVEFDDEPWCFLHSPDSGSNVAGYSYAAVARSLAHLDEV